MILKLLKYLVILWLIPLLGSIVGGVISGIIAATGHLPMEYDPLCTPEAWGIWTLIGTVIVVFLMILIKFGILD
ncbi:hypothetical protein SAMN05443661_12150 [Natronobacterium gregoryi]|uniref:Uncharacterized protein n=2 Tax=Natronobacterium gregoryi TaxID=44930 RepID=L0ALI5_NATGS|nr:hypothetical protein Natgr_3513 [Natronobacterium gregoryi SP2]SFJ30881.1 hypothetical protein SAMN05443661_12150 [Natronobacterium gregoryi]